MRTGTDWVSASDLAEYAYCPRALYYRRASPNAPPPERALDGARDHARRLGAERRRAEHPGAIWAGVLLGLAIAAVGAAGWLRP